MLKYLQQSQKSQKHQLLKPKGFNQDNDDNNKPCLESDYLSNNVILVNSSQNCWYFFVLLDDSKSSQIGEKIA
jgi:hypothetical protein